MHYFACSALVLHNLERPKGQVGALHDNRVGSTHDTAGEDDAHRAGFPDELTRRRPLQYGREQPVPESIQLHAWVTQTGELDDRVFADAEQCAGGQGEQVDAACRNVLPQVPGCYDESGSAQRIVEFGGDQMDLAKIRLRWIARHAGAMPDRAAGMSVPLDAQARNEPNLGLRHFAECMSGTACHRGDRTLHDQLQPGRNAVWADALSA